MLGNIKEKYYSKRANKPLWTLKIIGKLLKVSLAVGSAITNDDKYVTGFKKKYELYNPFLLSIAPK